jgi:acyl carrier protein
VTGLDLGPLRERIAARYLRRGDPPLTEETPLVSTGRLDSFGIVELVAFIEDQYGVRLRDEDVVPAAFETLGSIASIVDRARR